MRSALGIAIAVVALTCCAAWVAHEAADPYRALYDARLTHLLQCEHKLEEAIASNDLRREEGRTAVRAHLVAARRAMKAADIWLRYLGPLPYKSINGPLPVEWETE
ncbi:MAG TPA: hypothetical protein VHL57_06955, partial [Flavobacteriales bacterium]|nr:hypothetical protein [Flavobacteriales bacterium]